MKYLLWGLPLVAIAACTDGAADPMAPETTTTTPTTPAPAPVPSYSIDVRFLGTFTETQRTIVQTAVSRWQSTIQSELDDVALNSTAGRCFAEQPALNETVDDLLLFVTASNIDGPSKTIAQAGPCFVRNTGNIPAMGVLRIDTSDLTSALQAGLLDDVIQHEIGHVLGIGTIWEDNLLIGSGGTDPRFIGATALAEFKKLSPSATGVPVENQGGAGTRDGHWRESTFGNELMTGYINANSNPMSRVTLGSLADIGYKVDFAAAQAYTLPTGSSLRLGPADEAFVLDGHEELITPVGRVGR
jgi:hypothetical protein